MTTVLANEYHGLYSEFCSILKEAYKNDEVQHTRHLNAAMQQVYDTSLKKVLTLNEIAEATIEDAIESLIQKLKDEVVKEHRKLNDESRRRLEEVYVNHESVKIKPLFTKKPDIERDWSILPKRE